MIYTRLVTRTAQCLPRVLPLIVGLLLVTASGTAEAQKRKVTPEARQQWEFGIDMAKRGLWSEALFRFEQARRMEPEHPKILSNIAVAHEALGLFEEALNYYQQALRLAPRERDVRRNYSRFVEYYQNFRGEPADEEPGAGGPAAEPGLRNGSPGTPAAEGPRASNGRSPGVAATSGVAVTMEQFLHDESGRDETRP